MRRDNLIARVRDVDRMKNARIRDVTLSPTFDRFSTGVDSQVESLMEEKNDLIRQIYAIDERLARD